MVLLSSILTFYMADETVDKIINYIVRLSSLIFGPIMCLGNLYFVSHFKALSSVCGATGIEEDDFNAPSVFLLIIFSIIGFSITIVLILYKGYHVI